MAHFKPARYAQFDPKLVVYYTRILHLKTNTSYLSKIINEYKKMPFKQYLTPLRIERLIKELKEDTILKSYTIEVIGQSIGYSNASAFTRAFKKYKGVSPSEYIKS